MQPASAFVVVCSILAMHIPSPVESADDGNGNTDKLFKLVQGIDENTPVYVTKRSFKDNLELQTGATATCLKSAKKFANDTASQFCVTVKTENAGTPFLSTFIKEDDNTIQASVGSTSTKVTVLYVSQDEKCYIIQLPQMTSPEGNNKACDLISTKLDSTDSSCDTQFTTLCDSNPLTLSTTSACSDVPTPSCTGTK